MLQYSPNFSYMEVDRVMGLDSLDLMDGNLDWGSQGILEDLDSGTEGLDLKNLGFENWDLDCLASCLGLLHFSN